MKPRIFTFGAGSEPSKEERMNTICFSQAVVENLQEEGFSYGTMLSIATSVLCTVIGNAPEEIRAEMADLALSSIRTALIQGGAL